ncbi:chlorophyll A-B binding protein [Aureococcus anophagefferens]|nr:chlorophyll A-B binding protein [Aureococcus anophagefferens]
MARCASAAPAYGSGAYRAFLAALAAGWCVVLLRGFRQCFKELKRIRRAKRSRDHLLAHLPFGVGAAFFLVAALRLAYCAKLLAAARGPACGEDAALHDAAEPLLLVALSSISLYWWQLADSHARMAPANSRASSSRSSLALTSSSARRASSRRCWRGGPTRSPRACAPRTRRSRPRYAQGLATPRSPRARRLDASLRRMARASGERRSSAKAPERLARLRRRVTILYGVCGVGGVLGALVALASRRGDQDARTFWLYAVALPAVELPVAALASFLGFRTNYDELDVARSRSIYERAGARLSAAGRRLSGLVALPRLRSAGSGSDPLGSPQVDVELWQESYGATPRGDAARARARLVDFAQASSKVDVVNPMGRRSSAAPASQKASVVVKDSIGVDPGPIEPSGLFWEDKESLARRRAVEIKHGRISMMAFLGMMVQELGITFPGSINLDGSVQFSDILKDGMGFAAINNIPKFGLFQIVAFGFIAETAAMPATQYTGGPRTSPAATTAAGTIPGGYPFTTQIEDPTAARATCELQNGRAAMLGVTGAMMHSQLDSCDHHFYPITPTARARPTDRVTKREDLGGGPP